jgi:hypothetical protein
VSQKDIVPVDLRHTRSATTDRCVHANIAAKAKAVKSQPKITAEVVEMLATGTSGAPLFGVNSACPNQHPSVDSGGLPNRVPAIENGILSEGDGARTRNYRIDNPVKTAFFILKIRI